MSKKSFAADAEALLNAQKVDASVITDECEYTEIIHTSHGALRTSPQRVFVSFSFPKEMNKVDIMKYLFREVLELKGKVKHFRENFAWEYYK